MVKMQATFRRLEESVTVRDLCADAIGDSRARPMFYSRPFAPFPCDSVALVS